MEMPEILKDAFNVPPDPHAEQAAIEHQALTDELLAEYAGVCDKLSALEKIKDSLRAQILAFAKERRGAIPLAGWTLFLQPKKGACTIDWARYVEDQLGTAALKELEEIKELAKSRKANSPYIKVAEDSVNVKVVKGGSENAPEY